MTQSYRRSSWDDKWQDPKMKQEDQKDVLGAGWGCTRPCLRETIVKGHILIEDYDYEPLVQSKHGNIG